MNLKDKEKDVFIILNTGKCSWGKCLFCGWGRLEFPKKNSEELLKEFSKKLEKILKKERKIKRIKLYCSGSFLDALSTKTFAFVPTIFWLITCSISVIRCCSRYKRVFFTAIGTLSSIEAAGVPGRAL